MPALKLIATPDAELLGIGAELDKVERDRRALLEAEERRTSAGKAACRAVGLPAPAHRQDPHAWAVYQRRLAMVPYAGKDAVQATWCMH